MGFVSLGEVDHFSWTGFSQIFRQINISVDIYYAVTNRIF